MTPTEHVADLLAKQAEADAYFKWAKSEHKRCAFCDENRSTHAWMLRGKVVGICDQCQPECEEKGCHQLMLMGGEGGCKEHEHLYWDLWRKEMQRERTT